MMMASGWFRLSRRASVLLAAILLWTGAAPFGRAQSIAKASRPAVAALSTNGGVAVSGDGPIRGPMLGFLFDSSARTLRPMPGIPGASHVGDALPIGITPRLLEVSPDQNYALAVEDGSGAVYAIDLRLEVPTAQRINGAASGADRIFMSPLGKSAALYFRAARQVEILTGLPESPAVKTRVDLASVSGLPTAVAVSDDGATLAIAAAQGDTGSLNVAGSNGNVHLAGSLGQAAQLAFLHDSQDLLVADTRRSEVVLVRNVGTAPQSSVVASRQDGLEQPVAVSVSRDNRTAFAVSSADRKVARMPLSGGAVEFIDCPCEPTGLQALAGGSVFRLTAASNGPIFMLDARTLGDNVSAEPRVLFIPAAIGGVTADEQEARTPRGRVRR